MTEVSKEAQQRARERAALNGIRKAMGLSPVYYADPEKIHQAVVTRILHCKELEAELSALREELDRLRTLPTQGT